MHTSTHELGRISKKEYVSILLMRTFGNFLIFSSLFFLGKTFYQPIKEEVRYYYDKQINKTYVIAHNQAEETIKRQYADQQSKEGFAKLLNLKTVEVMVPQDPAYSIVIPKIGANSKIMPNVNPANEPEYLEALTRGVAHAQGTAFPGEGGHVFLFAHSTDYIWNVGTYNAVFYLLYKLEKDDEVNLFYKGQRYVYKVTDKIEVDPSEIEYLTRKTDEEFLTLQTCWPPGTTFKRMLIFAKRVAN